MRIINKKEAGVTILESAILFVIFSAFVIGVVAVVNYLQESRFVRNVLERELSETAVKPFRFDGAISVNYDGLEEYLNKAKDGIEGEFAGLIKKGEKYYIELIAAELDINPIDGTLKGAPSVKLNVSSGASGFIPGELLQKTDFGKISDKYLKNATKKDGAFIYASPSAVHQLEVEDLASRSSLSMSTKNRYLPKAVIIFGRVFYGDVDNWPLSYLKSYAKLDTVYYSSKVVTLRGDYDL